MAARSPERCGGRPAVHWRAGDRATGRRDTEQRGGVMDEQPAVGAARDLGWLLDDLADRVDYFRRAVILSRDGLVVAASAGLNREDAEHLSALAAGVQSLVRGAGQHFGAGQVRQTIIELEQAF